MVDFPCICGHLRNQHVSHVLGPRFKGICYESVVSETFHLCDYVPDNLKYLELLEAKRNA